MFDDQTHIYLTPVRAERAGDFESFIRDVAQPAMNARRPELAGRYRLLRPSGPEAGDDGVLTYAFVFDGGSMDDDWDLGALLQAHLGEEEASRLMADWVSTFAAGSQWVSALQQTDDPTQVGWTFTPVDL